ncbi:MAG: RNA-binding protein [Vicinamibacteria bacterium]|jgi:RNA recognition motif-containing protein|nr:RNA-binding protein [Vicinamibacteria bacterium]
MGRKLYVGNLAFSMSDETLSELFAQVGKVESARVVRDQGTGQSRGFAFVEMATDEEAQQAISQLNQRQVEGRAIVVNEARPKTEGGGGGGRGGFGGGRGPGRGPSRGGRGGRGGGGGGGRW